MALTPLIATEVKNKHRWSVDSVKSKDVIVRERNTPIFADNPGLIDECINEALEIQHADRVQSTLGKCADYALVGAAVLSELFPGHFAIVAGGEVIDCGGGRYLVLSPTRSARRSAQKLEDLREYHCWIEHQPIDGDTSQPQYIIDFTVRHDKATVESFGEAFDREISKPYIWLPVDAHELFLPPELAESLLFRGRDSIYWSDKRTTALLKEYGAGKTGLVSKCSAAFFTRLAEKMASLS